MSKLVIKGQPMVKTFTKYGDVFTLEQYNAEMNTYLYKRVRLADGRFSCYEIVIPRKVKVGDGTYIERYPTSEEFKYGSAVTTANLNKAMKYLANGCHRIENN